VSLTLVPEDVAARVHAFAPQRVFDPALAPRYPSEALRNGRTAEIQHSVTVNAEGAVKDTKIVSSGVSAEFAEAVLDYVRKSKYITGRRDGVPVEGVYEGKCIFTA